MKFHEALQIQFIKIFRIKYVHRERESNLITDRDSDFPSVFQCNYFANIYYSLVRVGALDSVSIVVRLTLARVNSCY